LVAAILPETSNSRLIYFATAQIVEFARLAKVAAVRVAMRRSPVMVSITADFAPDECDCGPDSAAKVTAW